MQARRYQNPINARRMILARDYQSPIEIGELLLQNVKILRCPINRRAARPDNVELTVVRFMLRELRLSRTLHMRCKMFDNSVRSIICAPIPHIWVIFLPKSETCALLHDTHENHIDKEARLNKENQSACHKDSLPKNPCRCAGSESSARGKAKANRLARACGERPCLAASSHIEGPKTSWICSAVIGLFDPGSSHDFIVARRPARSNCAMSPSTPPLPRMRLSIRLVISTVSGKAPVSLCHSLHPESVLHEIRCVSMPVVAFHGHRFNARASRISVGEGH